jgi:hypothetical protein
MARKPIALIKQKEYRANGIAPNGAKVNESVLI